jgi:class 3 adenylate cyclase
MIQVKSAYTKEYVYRTSYLRLAKMQNEEIKTAQILSTMLPTSVMQEIHTHGVIAHYKEVASVMFCDIVSFTALCSRVSARDVVEILNFMFTTFDNIVTKNHVYKVETIGDCYMACGGVVKTQPSFTADLLQCGLDFQHASLRIFTPENNHIQLRIGVHTGPVLAGVVGQKMPRYHLFGKTISVAEQYEAQGIAGEVIVCDETWRRTQDNLTRKKRKRKRKYLSLCLDTNRCQSYSNTNLKIPGLGVCRCCHPLPRQLKAKVVKSQCPLNIIIYLPCHRQR